MKILLIEPSNEWVSNSPAMKNYEQIMLPVGLMYLCSYLKSKLNGLVEVKIINTLVDLDNIEELRDILIDYKPQIIGIRCVLYYNIQVNQLVEITKKVLPDSLIIAGGPNINSNTQILSNEKIDLFVKGEGEVTFYNIVKCMIDGGLEKLTSEYKYLNGIFYRSNDQIIENDNQTLIEDLSSMPIPDYTSIDFNRYSGFLNYGYNRRKMGVMVTSRGCPYKCIYCHNIFSKKYRSRNADNIYQEIKSLYEQYGIQDYCIIDDNFSQDSKRVEIFANLIVKNNMKIKLYFPNGLRADTLSEELVDALISAGTIWITYSLETSSERMQKLIKKNVKIEKLKDIVDYTCKRELITNLCVMVGFPTETIEEAEHSLKFLSQFKSLVIPYYFSVKYYPGTELYDTREQYGLQISNDALMNSYHGHTFNETPTIKNADFQRLYFSYLRDIYLNPERINNATSILKKHFTIDEVNDIYSLFFRRKIKDLEKDLLTEIMGR